MKRKISLVLIVAFMVSVFSGYTIFAATSCKFNTPKAGEFFNHVSIFEITTSSKEDNNCINLIMKGKFLKASQCRITLFNSNGEFATSLKSSDSYDKKIMPLREYPEVTDFRGGVRTDFANPVISETPVKIKFKTPKKTSEKYFIIVNPNECEVKLENISKNKCSVKRVSAADSELINDDIFEAYYNCVLVTPMYLFPDVVESYLNDIVENGNQELPFFKYQSDIWENMPQNWAEDAKYLAIDVVSNSIGIVKDTVNKIVKNAIVNRLKPGYDPIDAESLQLELQTKWYKETYRDILDKIVIEKNDSLIKQINSSNDMKMFKDMSTVIGHMTDVSEIKKYPEYAKYADVLEKMNVLKPLNKGLKWWQIGDDFLANLLMAYDNKLIYVETLEMLCNDSNNEAHIRAIEEIKKSYSESFAQRFIYACDESGLFDEAINASVGEVVTELGLSRLDMLMDISDIAIKIALGTVFKSDADTANMQRKIYLSTALASEATFEMMNIQDRCAAGELPGKALPQYACLFDIVKATRVYQYEAIRKACDSTAERLEVDKKIKEIKNTYIGQKISKYSDDAKVLSSTMDPILGATAKAMYTFDNGFYNRNGADIDISKLLENTPGNKAAIYISTDNKEWVELGTQNTGIIDLSAFGIEPGAKYKYIKAEVNTSYDIPRYLENKTYVSAYYTK